MYKQRKNIQEKESDRQAHVEMNKEVKAKRNKTRSTWNKINDAKRVQRNDIAKPKKNYEKRWRLVYAFIKAC